MKRIRTFAIAATGLLVAAGAERAAAQARRREMKLGRALLWSGAAATVATGNLEVLNDDPRGVFYVLTDVLQTN